MTLRLVTGFALTAALSVAMLILPHTHGAVSMAAEVRQALQQVNTWHLRGWKLLDGKQTAWEVWGQRSPFFYRERIGDETVIDDGKQRVRILEAAPELNRAQGIVLRTPSQRNLDIVGEGFTSSFKDVFPTQAPLRETTQEIVLEAPNDTQVLDKRDLYTISKRTWLPEQYEVRAGTGAETRIVEHLDAEYDVPLAAGLTRLEWPANDLVVDAGSAPDNANLPEDNVARSGGLTVQLTPLAMDSQGRILARVRGWMGATPILGEPFYMHVIAERPAPNPQVALNSITDDQGRPYLFVLGDGMRMIPDMKPGADHLVYFAPFTPLSKSTSLPRHLKVTLEVAPWAIVKMSGAGKGENAYGQQSILMTAHLTWDVTLPNSPAPLDPDAYLPRGWRELVKTTSVEIPPLDEAVIQARAEMQRSLQSASH